MNNYGILKNSLPAERNSGLRFIETFESASEVEKNGGTINGSPTFSVDGAVFNGTTDYIEYSGFNINSNSGCFSASIHPTRDSAESVVMSIGDGTTKICKFVYNAGGNFEIRMNNRVSVNNQIITTSTFSKDNSYNVSFKSTGLAYEIYVNGVYQSLSAAVGVNDGSWLGVFDFIAPVLYLGVQLYNISYSNFFEGILTDVKIFNKELTADDILNYYNNSMFNYENEAELILPMGLKQHDPTNGYSKDVSGNGNNAVFGAGTAEPTKLSDRHGYLFDGTDDYMQTSNELSLPEATFGAMVKFNSANLNCAVSFGDTGDLYVLGTGVQASEGDIDKINFGMFSSSWKIAKTSYAPILGKQYFIVGVVRGTTIELWVNGVLEDTDTIAIDARSFLSNIGKRFDPSNPNFFDGEIDYVFQKSEALSPIQIQDLFIELKQGVNIK